MAIQRTDHHDGLSERLFELTPDVLAVVDGRGRIVRLNRAGRELIGLDDEDLAATRLVDIVHPSDRDAMTERLRSVADGFGESFRFRARSADGGHRWLETRAVLGDDGLIFAVCRDITDSQDADAERLIESFVDAPLGMALMDPDGSFRRVNAALCRLLDRTADELLESSIFEIVAEDGIAGSEWSRERLRAAERGTFQVETHLRRADGHPAVAIISATLVRNPRGEPLYYVCQFFDLTRRNEVQEQLVANEAKLAEAQQIARLGSWEWEIATDSVVWSDELYRIYGVRPDRFPGSYGSYLDKVHADDRARVARVIETAVAERRGWSLDYRIVRPDDEVRMIHARGEVVLDDHGRPALVRGTAQDVTESRRVEDALRAAEQLFRRAFDDAPIGMALIDLEGRWLRLNRSIAQMLGRTEQDLRAMRLADVSHPDDRRLDRPLIKELLAGRRRSFAIEKRFVHADGHVIHTLVHVSLMHGDGERPLYFLCQMVDVTERRRAEAAQRAGEERLQAIIDNSPALIFVKDAEHRYLLVNRRWQELFQVSADEAIGRRSADVLPTDRIPGHEAMDAEVMATGTVLEAMSTVSPPGAQDERFFLLVKFPLRDHEGQISGVCSIATDITDRHRNAKVRAELEQRLAQTQRLESVGQLAGGVAHDFNNLLSVILTCVGFAQRELPADSPVREDIEEIGRAADRAAALTRQLLMFSRREVVKPEVIDAGALVRDLERLLNRTLSERIALRISIGPGIAPVLADRAQLEQVLVNLAVNARDAMPGGGTLAIAVNPAPGGVRITVADEGVGMDPDVVEHAFEPFFTTKEAGEGTGLGLATVHGIVTDSGGTVEIDSTPGAGTVVTIWLPATAEGATSKPEVRSPADRATTGATVMVVEDQDPVRRQACRILEAHGYRVYEASGAEEALDGWRDVDVLVTDVVMPGMTGQELAERARTRTPAVKVVYMSGHTEDVIVRNGARAGAIAFVQKPFTRDSLLRSIEDALAAPAAAVTGAPTAEDGGWSGD
jgi:two-component system, cell cycle sensor histidine kinase and response regulator CckA